MIDVEHKEQEKYSGVKENGLAAQCRARGITVSSVKDLICASRQGLGGSTGRWESKRDQ
jgi:alpha-D-ribose 1-methylphosphonate 5-triphosphate diphosphatase PhnM